MLSEKKVIILKLLFSFFQYYWFTKWLDFERYMLSDLEANYNHEFAFNRESNRVKVGR